MKKLKKNKGITLIALVITIIVLLILAGVTIATLTGDNGILTQADNAKVETRGASVEEARDLWKINQETDNYAEIGTAQTLDELLNDLRNQKLLTDEEVLEVKDTGKVTIGTRTIVFTEFITVSEVIAGDEIVEGTESDPMYVSSIEDLVILAKEANKGKTDFNNIWIALSRNLDFQSDDSYKNPNATTYIENGVEVEYGDINGDGQNSGIKTEMTTGQGFMPIGNGYIWMSDTNIAFNGNIDGNGKELANLYMHKIEVYQPGMGLIGTVNKQCTVKNLTLKNIDLETSYNGSGGNNFGIGSICGIMKGKENKCIIQNCTVSGNITIASGYVSDLGGIVGAVSNTDIINCKNYCNIESNQNLGYGTDDIGGILGESVDETDGIKIEKCENYGDITLKGEYINWIGGIVGNFDSDIIDCKNYGTIYVENCDQVGGVVGRVDGNIYKSINQGNIEATISEEVGGISGFFIGSVEGCVNNGIIQGDTQVGGISGNFVGTIKNCCNTGNISATSAVGGISGYNGVEHWENESGNIKNSYNVGIITGESEKGGISGVNMPMSTVEKCYCLNTSSDKCYTDKDGNIITDGMKTETEMQQNSFVILLNDGNTEPIWKRDTENKNNGYPILDWQ